MRSDKTLGFVEELSFAGKAHFVGRLNHFVIGKAHASHGGLANNGEVALR